MNVCVVKIYGLNTTGYQFFISFPCSAFNWFEQTTKQSLVKNNHYILFETITNNVQRLETEDDYGTLSRAETTKLCLLNFHVISPNATKCHQLNWIKRFYRDSIEQNSCLEKKCRIARMEVDYSSSILNS